MTAPTIEPPRADGRTIARDAAATRRLTYQPGLDGLRALAVVSVLLYHGDVGWIPGGFLGVEVFFVISGYLITCLLLAEWKERDRIDLPAFWGRRARRLLPALFGVMAVTAAVSLVWFPDEVATRRGELAAAFAYVTNWFLIFTQQSYFEAVGRPSPLTHLWSLAVEEQFYLLWPPLFVLFMRRLGRRWTVRIVVLAAAGSVALMWSLYDPNPDPSRVYYGTDTRAAGLLVGVLLAFWWAPWRLSRERMGRGAGMLLDVVGLLALAALTRDLLRFDEYTAATFQGGFALVALTTAVVIAVVVHPATHLGRVLGLAPLRWVGQRSYGLYLWHWPIYVVTRPGLDVDLDGPALLGLRLGLTAVAAIVSYRYLEQPIRSGAVGAWLVRRRGLHGRPRVRRIRASFVALLVIAVAAPLTVAVARAEPPPPPEWMAAGPAISIGPGTAGPPTTLPDSTSTSTEMPTPTTEPSVPGTGEPASTLPGQTPVTDPPATAPATPSDPADPTTRWTHITAIGDSVMLGSATQMSGRFGDRLSFDAAVGRPPEIGIAMLRQWRDQGVLGDAVVVHLGNNGVLSAEQFDELMEVLRNAPRVVIINVKLPRPYQDHVNQVLAEGVSRWPNAVLADWFGLSSAHQEWFYSDGMHLRPDGAQAFTDMVVAALSQ